MFADTDRDIPLDYSILFAYQCANGIGDVYEAVYHTCGQDYVLPFPHVPVPGDEGDELTAYAIFMASGVDPLADDCEGYLVEPYDDGEYELAGM